MRGTITTLSAALAVAVFAATASAQSININEIYASHAGTDDREFVELIGTPGMSLDYLMVLVVEGEGAGAGTLDRTWSLTGNTMPADGYFVLGDDAVANLDMSVGVQDTLEDGTETIYLVDAVNQTGVATIVALAGTSIDLGSSTTSLPTLSTILDLVGMVNDDYPAWDQVYDGAVPLGPYGSFFPGGVFRGGDYPNQWCRTTWLDYDVYGNLAMPRTPGTANGGCGLASCTWYCGSGVNMDTYTISTGYVLGGTYMGTVGFSAPNVGAVVAGYLGSLVFPIWGQEGLVNVGAAEVMGLPAMIGPSPVTISWVVPPHSAYVGYHVYTQAAAFGGGAINLTCAFDCTAGY